MRYNKFSEMLKRKCKQLTSLISSELFLYTQLGSIRAITIHDTRMLSAIDSLV